MPLAWREAAIAALALALLLVAPALFHSPAFEDFVIHCSAMALFATSLNLLVGSTGMISFGHGLFYGLGAYAFALLMQRTALPLPLAALLTLLLAAMTALVVGAICIRLRTIYFAFVTLAMQMLFYSFIISWQELTGGDQGLRGGIPRRMIIGLDLNREINLYFVCATVLILGLFAMRHVTLSPFGATLRMLRDNEARAGFLGIPIWRAKLAVFVIAAVFAALGGILASLFVSGAYPELADWPISGQAIFAIMLGGIGSFLGPLVGTALLLGLNDAVTRVTEYYGLVLGLVILLFALGLRRGVTDFVVERLSRARP
jgi:branched-chain amino acid transport system permease protein